MIGVGKEVARVLMGERSRFLHPFRFSRFAEGALHPSQRTLSLDLIAATDVVFP